MNSRTILQRAALLALSAAALVLFPSGCGSEAGSSITLTGTLTDGARDGRSALAGYKVKCVIPAAPTSSSTATADASGKFTLDFAGGALPFACFVLDASDVQVASLFVNSTTGGQTIQIEASLDLGTVTVDVARGVALSSAAATVVTSIAAECPLGLWTGTVGVNSDCSGDTMDATLWIGKDAAGGFVLSQAHSPHKIGTCGLSAFAPTGGAVTYPTGGNLGWSFDMDHPATADAEVSTSCSQLSIIYTQTGCGTCGASGNLATVCQGTGALTCVSNAFVFTRK